MDILLLYFSGSGHTARCASYLQKSFEKLGHQVASRNYRAGADLAIDIDRWDLIGFGYPIHAFNVPEAFHRFIKSLPSQKTPYFFFKVSGEPFHFNDASSYPSYKVLKKKGYELIGEKHFLMPYNIMFRYPDELAKQMDLYLEALCDAFAIDLCNEEAEKIPYRFGKKVLSFLLRIEWIAPKVNAPFVRFKKKKCTECGLCEKRCPMQAIAKKKNGRYRVMASRCAMCMRCTMNCPSDAISFGIMNPWKVNGPYRFDELRENPDIDPHFIHEGMKGYFRHFLPYFRKQDQILKEKGIPNPMDHGK